MDRKRELVAFVLVLLLWIAQVTFVIVSVATGGGREFAQFLSSWYYVLVALLYTVWLAGYGHVVARRIAYSLLVFYHGAVWIWTLLTFALVASGAPRLFDHHHHQAKPLSSGVSTLMTFGLFLAHFSPIVLIVLYALAYRRSLALFYHAAYHASLRMMGRAVAGLTIALVVVVLPGAPAYVYVLFFDPFQVYEVSQQSAPWLLIGLLVFALMVALQFALLTWLWYGLPDSGAAPSAYAWLLAQYRHAMWTRALRSYEQQLKEHQKKAHPKHPTPQQPQQQQQQQQSVRYPSWRTGT